MENGENMIEKISFYLAKKIYICSEANNLCVADEENEDIQVLQYGIECIINMSIPFIVIFGYAWYFKMLMPMIIWMTMFLSLRNYIGGYHANSHFQCILYSIVYGIIAMYGINLLSSVPLIIKLIACGAMLLVNIFAGPVIHDQCLKGYKIKYCKMSVVLLVGGIICAVFFQSRNINFENSFFMGIFSAEFLYWIDLFIYQRKRNSY